MSSTRTSNQKPEPTNTNPLALGLVLLNATFFGLSIGPAAGNFIYSSPAFLAMSVFSWFGFRDLVPLRTVLVANSLLIAPFVVFGLSFASYIPEAIASKETIRQVLGTATIVLAAPGFVWHFYAPAVAHTHRAIITLISLLCLPVTGMVFLLALLSATGSYF